MFWRSFLCNVVFEKDLPKKFGGVKKYEGVPPLRQSPPNFPIVSGILGMCCKEGGEVARGYDPRGLLTGERQPAIIDWRGIPSWSNES
jgi:hypothetical protein